MPFPSIFTEAQRAFIAEAYLERGAQPREIVLDLNKRFGAAFNIGQIRRYVNANLTKRRKFIEEKIGVAAAASQAEIVAKAVADAAIPRATKDHSKALERWIEKSERAVDRAFLAIENTRDVRGMSSGAAAVSSLIKTFRLCAGIEDTASKPLTFNFNFANEAPRKLTDAEREATEIEVAPAQN